jgi:imidazoleglycerol-phosphate dehydratase
MTTVVRETKETKVRVELTRDSGVVDVSTTIPFLDHMLVDARPLFRARLFESPRLATCRTTSVKMSRSPLGAALSAYLPASAARYGERTIPMDDALVHCALDVGGRAYYRGPLPAAAYDHWMRSFADNARATLHFACCAAPIAIT